MRAILLALIVVCLTGCTGSNTIVIPERQPTPLGATTVGELSGTVAFEGETAEPKKIPVGGFPGCLHDGGSPVDESMLVRDGRLANVFVYIKSGLDGKVFRVPTDPVVLNQKYCLYRPHVVGVQRYQPIKVLNSDQLLHNVHAISTKQPGFNFGQPVAGMESLVQMTEEEVMVRVKCDVHGWMGAWIGVLDHPYFSVSGEDGAFSIKNVPPGKYVLEAWHETLGTQAKEVTVGEKEVVPLEFTFQPK